MKNAACSQRSREEHDLLWVGDSYKAVPIGLRTLCGGQRSRNTRNVRRAPVFHIYIYYALFLSRTPHLGPKLWVSSAPPIFTNFPPADEPSAIMTGVSPFLDDQRHGKRVVMPPSMLISRLGRNVRAQQTLRDDVPEVTGDPC